MPWGSARSERSQFPSSPCPFTPGVGVSGVYFSFDSGKSWTQPTYTGYTARGCKADFITPVSACAQTEGSIGTLPWYEESGLVSDGDPGLAFGAAPGPHGFSWSNGDRLYYSNLAANFPAAGGFKGFEAIAVSRMDNPTSSSILKKSSWMTPVVVSRQSNTTFSDKSQIWADNAASSPFFDNVQGRPEIDGIAGARSDLAPAPSVDIANGAPTGNGATNHMVMSFVSSQATADENPHVDFTESSDHGASWTTPQQIETPGDRGFYTAPAISPDGSTVYVVYNAFTTPYQTNTNSPRDLVGLVMKGTVNSA